MILRCKRTIFSFTIAAIATIVISSCDDPKHQDQLPAITMTGRGTFGAMMNDNAWVACCARPGNGSTWADRSGLPNFIGVYGENKSGTIIMAVEDDSSIEANKSYQFTSGTKIYAAYSESETGKTCIRGPEHLIDGSITFSRLDASAVSGTFEFRLLNPNCGDSIIVKDGRFDLQ